MSAADFSQDFGHFFGSPRWLAHFNVREKASTTNPTLDVCMYVRAKAIVYCSNNASEK